MICCQGLTRRFGDFAAVDELSFELPAGAICAFLGPNGAGKSTTLHMLTGLLRPTSGSATVAGMAVTAGSVRLKRAIGVLPEHLGLFGSLTVEEHLEMAAPIYGLRTAEARKRTAQLLRVLGLEPYRDTFCSHCSHGTRKKTALALALLHNPRVLFLDEPFEGIDPVTSKVIREMLRAVAGHGITVFLTAHILPIAESLATHVMLIRKGRLVWNSEAGAMDRPLEQLYFDLVEAPPVEELPWLGPLQS